MVPPKEDQYQLGRQQLWLRLPQFPEKNHLQLTQTIQEMANSDQGPENLVLLLDNAAYHTCPPTLAVIKKLDSLGTNVKNTT